MSWRILAVFLLSTCIAHGQGAQMVLQKAEDLGLTDSQRGQIRAILSRTSREYNRLRSEERGTPGLSEKLSELREKAEDEALKMLTDAQRETWDELVAGRGNPPQSSSRGDPTRKDGSLIIPTIEELRNPPRPGAFGPSTSLAKTEPHPVSPTGYLILTDHPDPAAREALERLAEHRDGEVVALKSLGTLHESPEDFAVVQDAVRERSPRFVAIAPREESYRENMHLCMLHLLCGLDEDPELDALPGYLVASDPVLLAELVERTIQFRPLGPEDIAPVSIGAIEDADARRYRSYQKAKVMQKMFAEEGKESPAIIVTTRKSHTKREDFPELPESGGNIVMLPSSERHTFERLSSAAEEAINRGNVLFMFGHGTTSRICGVDIDAFQDIDFDADLIFCGSCMSASPYDADRVDLREKRGDKRFAFHAIDNGSVMMLGHMGLCGGFPKVFPMAELVLGGSSTGEAYQQLMNSIIGGKPIPDYYPRKTGPRDAANGYLYVLLGDPALVPIRP